MLRADEILEFKTTQSSTMDRSQLQLCASVKRASGAGKRKPQARRTKLEAQAPLRAASALWAHSRGSSTPRCFVKYVYSVRATRIEQLRPPRSHRRASDGIMGDAVRKSRRHEASGTPPSLEGKPTSRGRSVCDV